MNIQVFRITHDDSSGSNLVGHVFVLVNLPKSPYMAPSPKKLFIDPATDDGKSAAIEALVKRYFGAVEVVRLPLEFSQDSSGQNLKVPGVLSYRVRSLGERPSPEVADFLYPWLLSPTQGVATKVAYKGSDERTVRYSGTNAILAQFRIMSPSDPAATPSRVLPGPTQP